MTATLSSHILDTHLGKPAAGIHVTLHRVIDNSSNLQNFEANGLDNRIEKQYLAATVTNADGRIAMTDWHNRAKDTQTIALTAGRYTLSFETQAYFEAQNITAFYPQVIIDFVINDNSHYHIPLLLSTHGYSTYRGS